MVVGSGGDRPRGIGVGGKGSRAQEAAMEEGGGRR